MAYNGVIFAGTLSNINVAATSSLAAIQPLLTQIDFSLFGSVGIGAIQANLQVQLASSQKASLNIGIGILNPYVGFQIALGAIAVLTAQIAVALSGAIPAISLDVTSQLASMAAFQTTLGVQIGSLDALIQAGISAKGPAVDIVGILSGALSAGPIFLLSWENATLNSVGASISSDFTTGLTSGLNTISPGEAVYGILLVTKSPSAWAAIQATMKSN